MKIEEQVVEMNRRLKYKFRMKLLEHVDMVSEQQLDIITDKLVNEVFQETNSILYGNLLDAEAKAKLSVIEPIKIFILKEMINWESMDKPTLEAVLEFINRGAFEWVGKLYGVKIVSDKQIKDGEIRIR